MKSLADEMASVGKKLDDEELTSYVLAGLDVEYNSLVSSITARVEPNTFGELYSQLLAFENHLDLQEEGQSQSFSSINNAYRGRGMFSKGWGATTLEDGATVTVMAMVTSPTSL
jgi:hypothetical protein